MVRTRSLTEQSQQAACGDEGESQVSTQEGQEAVNSFGPLLNPRPVLSSHFLL